MKIGYVRVSTLEQHEERQKVELTEKANVEKIFLDKLSGKDTNRPQLQAMLEFAREGDTVYVSEFSRMARSTKDLLDIVQQLKEKQVQVISLKERFDTSTPAGELAMTMFAAIATFERKLMLERQREGIALAKEQGKYRGRKEAEKPADWQNLVEKYKCREISSVSELVRICGCSRPTIYKWLKCAGIHVKGKPAQLVKKVVKNQSKNKK